MKNLPKRSVFRAGRLLGLDAPINDDDSTAFGEIVGDEEAQTPFELLRDKDLRDEVSELLEVLDDRERKIIFQRFGLDDGKPKTLEEIGKKFGVTRERIRQLQNIALAKLRRALAKKEKPIVRDPNSIPQTRLSRSHQDERGQSYPAFGLLNSLLRDHSTGTCTKGGRWAGALG
jgi:hypothetical protein